jgi:hypothetical protein
VLLDIDSSEIPTHGKQEDTAFKGHFDETCYHPLFLFNRAGDLERAILRPGNVHIAKDWRQVLDLVPRMFLARMEAHCEPYVKYRIKSLKIYLLPALWCLVLC